MKAKVIFDGEDNSEADFPVILFSPKDRVLRAIRVFCLLLLCAAAAVFLPVIHFVLVPAFLISAMILPILKYKQSFLIDLSGLNCPGCQTHLRQKSLGLKTAELVVRLYCDECRKNIRLELLP